MIPYWQQRLFRCNLWYYTGSRGNLEVTNGTILAEEEISR